MNHIFNIIKIGASLGALAWTNYTLGPAGILMEIIKSFATELGAPFIAKYDPVELLEYLKKSNSDFDQDIKKLMISTVSKAVEQVKNKYLQENPYDDKFIKKTLERLTKDAKLKSYSFEEQVIMFEDQDAWLSNLHDYIFLGQEEEDGKLLEIEIFFKNNLPQYYNYMFIEGLKNEKDEKPLKAFLIKNLNSLANRTADISVLQIKLLNEIQALKNGEPSKTFLIAKSQLETITKKIDTNTDKILKEIKSGFDAIWQSQKLQNNIHNTSYTEPNFNLFPRYQKLKLEIDELTENFKIISQEKSEIEQIIKEINHQKASEKFSIQLHKLTKEQLEINNLLNKKKQELNLFEKDIRMLAIKLSSDEGINSYRLQQANNLFKQGKLEEANYILNSGELLNDKALIEKETEFLLEKRKILALEFIIKAQLTNANSQNPNWFEETCQYYLNAISLIENAGTCFAFAIFLHNNSQYLRALEFYKKALKNSDTDEHKALILENLGSLYYLRNEFGLAKEMYYKAFEIRELLAANGTNLFLSELAFLYNNLGVVFQAEKDFNNAKIKFNESLKIRESLCIDNPQGNLPFIADIFNNLGTLYHINNDFINAEKNLIKALEIEKSLEKENPEVYSSKISGILYNLANIYIANNDFGPANNAIIESMKIAKDLAELNPSIYLPKLAQILNTLGNFYDINNDYNGSLNAFEESLKLYRDLSEANPNIYLGSVADVSNNLGILFYNNGKISIAEKRFKESLKIYRHLNKLNIQIYQPDIVLILNNLGNLNRDKGKFILGEKQLFEALVISNKLAQDSPQAFLSYKAMTLNNLGCLHIKYNKFKSSENELLESLKLYKILANDSPQAYLPDVAMVLENLAQLHCNSNKIKLAEKEYKKSANIRMKFAKSNPTSHAFLFVGILARLASFYLYENPNKQKSIEYALSTYKQAKNFSIEAPEVSKYCFAAFFVFGEWGEDLFEYIQD